MRRLLNWIGRKQRENLGAEETLRSMRDELLTIERVTNRQKYTYRSVRTEYASVNPVYDRIKGNQKVDR